MAVGAFPLAKLGVLVVKQISKPIANAFARRAKSSRIFREYVCIPVAQLFHWYDVRVRMRILNLGKATSVPKLNEDKAIETGSQLLSEFILLGIASAMVIYEWRRSSEKEEAKVLEATRERQMLSEQLSQMELQLEQHRTQIRELTRISHSIAERQEVKWGKPKEPLRMKDLDTPATAQAGDEAKNINLDLTSEDEVDDETTVLGAVNDVVKLLPLGIADNQDLSKPYTPPWHLGAALSSSSIQDSDESYRPGMVMEAVESFLDLREEE